MAIHKPKPEFKFISAEDFMARELMRIWDEAGDPGITGCFKVKNESGNQHS